jgi:methylenetetrahydrofolate reductase (NADPH)
MKISDILSTGKPTVSFEFFPPKTDQGFQDLFHTIKALQPLHPDYVSVTYGAGGSTRRMTVDLVKRIKTEIGIEPMAHLTCVGSTRDEIAQILDDLKSGGTDNVLPLRGDPPRGETEFKAVEGGFSYASELVEFVRSGYEFCLAGACYPEKHPEAADPNQDLDHLKRKVDAGVDFLITQLFFDNEDFYRFRDRCVAAGINLPLIAGIMPIRDVKQIKRFTTMIGASLPADLLNKIESVEDDGEAVAQVGMYHSARQCEDLLANNVAGLHLYTLNRSTATRAIFQEIRHLLSPAPAVAG